ncbi:hypothetical protein [Mucilaginibacter celer]|uniref:Uncharacterized protein n=1 Tax=Mucilaginibacter celer TaxID=2305508 RepID=A0A494VK84_9SPHI|nr:hypothetical protein [Mucilaginibacter celer]AYL93831.1 hypothetical protein HYN43_000310 [Mucilaginibacter celer]
MIVNKVFSGRLFVLLLLLSASLTGAAVERIPTTAKSIVPVRGIVTRQKTTGIVYDKAILNRLGSVFKKYNTDKLSYTIGGEISMTDKADNSKKMSHVNFLLSKHANEFYYQLGSTQTLNAGGTYLYIDNKGYTILAGPQKPVVGNDSFKSLFSDEMAKNLQSEHYELLSSRKGAEQTITMLNEHHISCKQYAITIDTATLRIKKVFIRYTNFNAPLRTDNEKVVTVMINQWTNAGAPGKYLVADDVVTRDRHHKYKARGKYLKYQTVNL